MIMNRNLLWREYHERTTEKRVGDRTQQCRTPLLIGTGEERRPLPQEIDRPERKLEIKGTEIGTESVEG